MNETTKKNRVLRLLPGLLLCLIVMMAGIYGAQGIGELLLAAGILPKGGASPISGIFVAILLGIIIRRLLSAKPCSNQKTDREKGLLFLCLFYFSCLWDSAFFSFCL